MRNHKNRMSDGKLLDYATEWHRLFSELDAELLFTEVLEYTNKEMETLVRRCCPSLVEQLGIRGTYQSLKVMGWARRLDITHAKVQKDGEQVRGFSILTWKPETTADMERRHKQKVMDAIPKHYQASTTIS